MSLTTYPISFQIKLWRYLAFKEFNKAKSLIESLMESGNAQKVQFSNAPYEVYEASIIVAHTKKPVEYKYYFVYNRTELVDYCVSTSETNKNYLRHQGYLSAIFDE